MPRRCRAGAPPEYDDELRATIKRVRRHTMPTAPRIAALCDGVEHVVAQDVEGALVECGVWRVKRGFSGAPFV
jgi:O-methyltransferase